MPRTRKPFQPSEDPKLASEDPSAVIPPKGHRNRDIDTVKATAGSPRDESVGEQTNSKEGMNHSSQTGRT
ncbi:hypothetical protein [Variovorax paradoxus]|uniref:hypothetical protein n=1 Tax=Variovorax paradoxus TaxID=34073 RepID=UPI0029C8BEEF|nr:hypothetical protein RZE77_13105 [Variovorax paradoxus]